jgi:hypothetical protein
MNTGDRKPPNAYVGPALLLLSAPCWWVGAFAFFPIVGSVYDAPDSATQITIVSNHPTAWLAQNLCFLLGILAAAGGFAALTTIFRETPGWRFAQLGLLTTLAATSVGLGVLYRYVTLADSTADAPPMYAGAGANPLHMVFAVLTLVGFVCYGVALVQCRHLKWTGATAILLSGAMLAEVARLRDAFPPLFFYAVPFMLGVRLLFTRRSAWASVQAGRGG